MAAAVVVTSLSACSSDGGDNADRDPATTVPPSSTTTTAERFADYDYGSERGPEAWGELSPLFQLCGSGARQSPIDLAGAVEADLAPLEPSYEPSPVNVVDTGVLVQANVEPGRTIVLNEVDYHLTQITFHSPSEHTIDGESFPVEAQFLHQDATSTLAIVSVLIVAGAQNEAYDPLLAVVAEAVGGSAVTPAPVDLAALLPTDLLSYRYPGSLTTPPCVEGVSWVVLAEPVELSVDQIAVLTAVHEGNSRPAQPRNDRELLLG